jgi:quercetin dioxygenase-like cupin family protein
MATIKFALVEDTRAVDVEEASKMPEFQKERLPSEEQIRQWRGTLNRSILNGSETEPSLHEARLQPDVVFPSHAHAVGEVIYVTEGALIFGSKVVRAGGAVMIPGGTLYSFRSGPEGATFVNFRPTRDTSFVAKEDYAEWRKSVAGVDAAG